MHRKVSEIEVLILVHIWFTSVVLRERLFLLSNYRGEVIWIWLLVLENMDGTAKLGSGRPRGRAKGCILKLVSQIPQRYFRQLLSSLELNFP